MSFNHIVGNDKIKDLLIHSVKNNNILHSYMFVGQDGIGKFLFAKEFAKILLCYQQTLGISCDSCKSCLEFDTDNHPDFLVIQSEDNKSIKIEQIRYLQEKISEKPIVSDKKIYIINDSHLMTKEAQNCLLKTLEEPPPYAVIILVLSNENKLLNTIKSRCTKIVFSRLQDEEILQYFKENANDSDFNYSLLKFCDGSISRALSLNNDVSTYESINHIMQNFTNMDIVDLWNNSEILYQSKDHIYDLLDYINVILMDKLENEKDIRYANCINAVEKAKNKLLSNANYDMSIDNLLLNIWEEFNEKYSWG